jgi:glucose-6-phosphate dehydrogenase assembly protein OpcA
METEKKQNSANQVQAEISRALKLQPNSEGSKACLFNLIVYTQETRRTNYFKGLVKMIMSRFPCRIIFIQGNPSSQENYLRLQVSTEKSQDERGIVCDQIFIEASGQDIHRVYFLLFPLFVPDLPVYLLWGQDPTTEYTILPHLQYFATRLIFDSESTEDLQQFSRDMLNRLHSSPIEIVDMNWARIGGWREVLAHTFDSPERFAQLTTANVIEIVYNNCPSEMFYHPDTQAIYLQAWLASRLGWQFRHAEKDNHSQILIYQEGQTPHTIRLTPRADSHFQAEELLEIHVTGPNDYECHLNRIKADQVQVHTCNQYQCAVPFVLLMPSLRSGRSFMQEIFYQKVSSQYISMLKLISLISWR